MEKTNRDYDHDEEKHKDIGDAFMKGRKGYKGPRGKILGIEIVKPKEDK